MGGDKVLHVSFEADHLFVPLRQGAGGHQDAADVLDDLAFREFVQGLVRQGPAAGAEVGQDGGDDAAGEPAQGGAGPFSAGQSVVEGLQLRGYGARGAGEKLIEPLPPGAARARTSGSQSFCCPAGGTGPPEFGVRCGAGAANGGVGGAGVDAPQPSADSAAGLASVAAAAARLAGQLREGAGRRAAADRADQGRQGTAVGADRALRSADTHHALFAADGAGL